MGFGLYRKLQEGLQRFGQKMKEGVNKVLPYVQRGAEWVRDVGAPLLSEAGRRIGGGFGATMTTIGDTAQQIAGKVREGSNVVQRWAGGTGGQFNQPQLQNVD